jgi:hypothetical protein
MNPLFDLSEWHTYVNEALEIVQDYDCFKIGKKIVGCGQINRLMGEWTDVKAKLLIFTKIDA